MSVVGGLAFQDQMRGNYCWGCGADNPDGLQLKSYWDGEIAVAEWLPSNVYAAGPRHILNGGIIATLLDCQSVCTAIADGYRRDQRTVGSDPEIWYVTAKMTVEYLRPAPLDTLVSLHSRVLTIEGRQSMIECALEADGRPRARASVRAVRVPDDWRHGASRPPVA